MDPLYDKSMKLATAILKSRWWDNLTIGGILDLRRVYHSSRRPQSKAKFIYMWESSIQAMLSYVVSICRFTVNYLEIMLC